MPLWTSAILPSSLTCGWELCHSALHGSPSGYDRCRSSRAGSRRSASAPSGFSAAPSLWRSGGRSHPPRRRPQSHSRGIPAATVLPAGSEPPAPCRCIQRYHTYYIVPPEIISGQTRRPFACAFPAAPLFCSCPHISDCVTREKRHGSASADHFDHASPRHPAGSLFSSAGTRRL